MGYIPNQTKSSHIFNNKFPFYFSVITSTNSKASHFDEMMETLVRQTVKFLSHIQILIADNGSTNQTKERATHWVNLYPKNIRLIDKRKGNYNECLSEAQGEWLVFIEADDLLAHTYFQEIHNFLRLTRFDGNILASNSLLFDEPSDNFYINNESACKFKKTQAVDLLKTPEFFQTTANACLIRHAALKETGLRLNEKIKPSFKSGHFINLLLLYLRDFRITFIKEAKHFQRNREADEELKRQGWFSLSKYQAQMVFGYLDLLKQYKRSLGRVPIFLQNIILYECSSYITQLLEGGFPYPLTNEQQNDFFQFAFLLFQDVDIRQILLSTNPALDIRTRIAMLHTFKKGTFLRMPFVIEEVAPEGREVQLIHWATEAPVYSLRDAKGQRDISWEKRIEHRYKGRILCHEYRCWVPIHEGETTQMEVNGKRTNIICRNNSLESLEKTKILRHFYLPQNQLTQQQKHIFAQISQINTDRFQGAWLMMDRVNKADDNAEHLCRWILKKHPEQPVFFVLNKRSTDWDRLEREGFPLLAYGSLDHFAALTKISWLLSSHVDQPVVDPLRTRKLFGIPPYKTAFLQHGITMADISRWLNSISLDCLITSAHPEHEALKNGTYKLTERELVLAGFPRHDALLEKVRSRKAGKVILICPTWREELMRKAVYGLEPTQANKLFLQSDFYKKWNEVVSSSSLAKIARENSCRLIFLPHPETERFLPLFTPSEACSILRWTEVKSIQDLFANSAMAVTDYSSIVLDLGFIGVPVIYYQFNESPPYYTSQGRRPSYFDYKAMGMGPVVHTSEALEEWVRETFSQGCQRHPIYDERAYSFFHLRDGHNCHRVYEAIMARS